MKRYFVVASMLRGAIDPKPVDADTAERLAEIERLENEIELERFRPEDVFPLERVVWRQGVNGTPLRVWNERRFE